MKKDFYIFRHGQTDLNAQGVWQGCTTDALLNEDGKKQVKLLAEKIQPLRLTNLYCSPLLRTVQTANILATYPKNGHIYPVTILQDLRECNFGECEGLSMEDVYLKYGNDFVNKFLFPTKETWEYRFNGGESKKEVFKRVKNVLLRISGALTWSCYSRIGIVCHAGVISSLQCGLNLHHVSYDNCSILHLSYDSEKNEWAQVFD